MHLHPSLNHQLGLARHHDAEHAAARARRASEALPPRSTRRTPVLARLGVGRPAFDPNAACTGARA